MECKVWSLKCGVWSVKCRVKSVECGVWSVKCRVWSVKCEVKYCACRAKWHSTHNGSALNTAPATQNYTHDALHLPRDLHVVTTWRSPDIAIRKNTQHHTSKVLRLPLEIAMEVSKVLRLLMNPKITYLTIDVSCEASINFHHISQNVTPATQFARCHHLTQPWQFDLEKTRNTTRLKCCACHAKWKWTRLKPCACHHKANSSSENGAKVLRLSHRMAFDTFWNMLGCDKVLHLPHETRLRNIRNLQKRPLLQHPSKARPWALTRKLANGCGQLRTVATRATNTPQPPEWNCNHCYAFGKIGKTIYFQMNVFPS